MCSSHFFCGKSKMHGLKTKTLKRMLKKAGLKSSGKKATLRARAKSAHLIRGGTTYSSPSNEEYAPVGGAWAGTDNASAASMESAAPVGASYNLSGGRRHGLKTKTLKRMLKKAGLKVSGKKSTLTKRAKSAHLIRGGTASSGSAEQANPLGPSGTWGAV